LDLSPILIRLRAKAPHHSRLALFSFVRANSPYQPLEKRYSDTGNLGFGARRAFDGIVGMCTCNDPRWPETYRVMERSFLLCLMMLAEANFYVSGLPLFTPPRNDG
jgi:hypothetical protein